ncbi:MAG TPA: putative quinol monooxygenase [Propionicimonas sp.]|jgi:quinol monooxygenase YgiN|nr:putative quinol monooxygenase [Propionicimonas sp.]
MQIVHVLVQVVPDGVDAFIAASTVNARHSRQEPGVAGFEVLQSAGDPTRFVLVESYRDHNAALAHKQTPHYLTWREAVAPLMAEPRSSTVYRPV